MGLFSPSTWTLLGFVIAMAKVLLSVIALVVASTIGGIYFMQAKGIYPSAYPEGSRTTVALPSEHDMVYTEPELTTSDGVKLKAYLMLATKYYKTRPTIIYFHANAGNMGHRLPIAKVLNTQMNFNVLMLSYRGYGLSEGSPTEKGIKIDAQTALDFITNHAVLGQTPIIFYGQSLGGAVAINLAADNKNVPAALILENTFLSIPSLIPHLIPNLSFLSFLVHQIWPSQDKLALLPADLPILLLSGEKDEIVPKIQMETLQKLANNRGSGRGKKHTQFKSFAKGTHNDTVAQDQYFQTLHKFVTETVEKLPGGAKAGGRGARFAN
ncbi:alpha/beta-hydrolase [Mrakia frigida]|uniref:alpha/beta hydrolase n=1 Tax=Mrakia frigida TaxID=29902 RepID=UPI003FCC0327